MLRSPGGNSSPARSAIRADTSPEAAISIAPAKNALANSGSPRPATPDAAKTMPAPSSIASAKPRTSWRALPDADPIHAGRLDRPQRRGRAAIERERNGDRGKDDRQREEGAREQREAGLAATAQRGEQDQRRRRPSRWRSTRRRSAHRARSPPAARIRRSARRKRAARRPDPSRRSVRAARRGSRSSRRRRRRGRGTAGRPRSARAGRSRGPRTRPRTNVNTKPTAFRPRHARRPREREDRAVQHREIAEQLQRARRLPRPASARGIRRRSRAPRAAASRCAPRATRSPPTPATSSTSAGVSGSTPYSRNAAKVVR